MLGFRETHQIQKTPNCCYKNHCVHFNTEQLQNTQQGMVYHSNCMLNKALICYHPNNNWCRIDSSKLSKEQYYKLILDTAGYPLDFNMAFAFPTCQYYEIDLQYATESDMKQIKSERTQEIIQYIKNYAVQNNVINGGIEIVFTLLDRIIQLECNLSEYSKQLIDETLMTSFESKQKKIKQYINSRIQEIKQNPRQLISQQDLLQILVYLDK